MSEQPAIAAALRRPLLEMLPKQSVGRRVHRGRKSRARVLQQRPVRVPTASLTDLVEVVRVEVRHPERFRVELAGTTADDDPVLADVQFRYRLT